MEFNLTRRACPIYRSAKVATSTESVKGGGSGMEGTAFHFFRLLQYGRASSTQICFTW